MSVTAIDEIVTSSLSSIGKIGEISHKKRKLLTSFHVGCSFFLKKVDFFKDLGCNFTSVVGT